MDSDPVFDARLYHPSTILLSGPSGSGKSCFTKSLLECANSIFQPEAPKFVILVYDVWQGLYDYFINNNLVHLAIKGIDDFDNLKEIISEKKDCGESSSNRWSSAKTRSKYCGYFYNLLSPSKYYMSFANSNTVWQEKGVQSN